MNAKANNKSGWLNAVIHGRHKSRSSSLPRSRTSDPSHKVSPQQVHRQGIGDSVVSDYDNKSTRSASASHSRNVQFQPLSHEVNDHGTCSDSVNNDNTPYSIPSQSTSRSYTRNMPSQKMSQQIDSQGISGNGVFNHNISSPSASPSRSRNVQFQLLPYHIHDQETSGGSIVSNVLPSRSPSRSHKRNESSKLPSQQIDRQGISSDSVANDNTPSRSPSRSRKKNASPKVSSQQIDRQRIYDDNIVNDNIPSRSPSRSRKKNASHKQSSQQIDRQRTSGDSVANDNKPSRSPSRSRKRNASPKVSSQQIDSQRIYDDNVANNNIPSRSPSRSRKRNASPNLPYQQIDRQRTSGDSVASDNIPSRSPSRTRNRNASLKLPYQQTDSQGISGDSVSEISTPSRSPSRSRNRNASLKLPYQQIDSQGISGDRVAEDNITSRSPSRSRKRDGSPKVSSQQIDRQGIYDDSVAEDNIPSRSPSRSHTRNASPNLPYQQIDRQRTSCDSVADESIPSRSPSRSRKKYVSLNSLSHQIDHQVTSDESVASYVIPSRSRSQSRSRARKVSPKLPYQKVDSSPLQIKDTHSTSSAYAGDENESYPCTRNMPHELPLQQIDTHDTFNSNIIYYKNQRTKIQDKGLVKLREENKALTSMTMTLNDSISTLQDDKRTADLILQMENSFVSELEDRLKKERTTNAARVSKLEDKLVEEKALQLENIKENDVTREDLINRIERAEEDNRVITDKFTKQREILQSSARDVKVSTYNKNIKELHSKLNRSEDEIASLQTSIIDTKKTYENIQEGNDVLIQSLRNQMTKGTRSRNMLKSETEKQLVKKHDEIVKLQDDVHCQSKIILTIEESFFSKIDDLEKKHAETKAELEVALQREQLRGSGEEQQPVAIENLQREISSLTRDHSLMENRYNELLQQLETTRDLAVERCKLEDNLQETEGTLEVHKAFVKMSNEKVLNLHTRVNELEKRRLSEDNIKRRQQAEIDKKSLSIVCLEARVSVLTSKCAVKKIGHTNRLRNAEHARLGGVGKIDKRMPHIKRSETERRETTEIVSNFGFDLTEPESTDLLIRINQVGKSEAEENIANKKIPVPQDIGVDLKNNNDYLAEVHDHKTNNVIPKCTE